MFPSRYVAILLGLLLLAAGCGSDSSPEAEYLRETRDAIGELLGEEAPSYTDEELLAFGERTCGNLADVTDGNALRRTIEAASVGSSDEETLQIAQATILVTTAARYLCPEHGRRLGLLNEGPQA